jgi:hypothetical protein
VVLAVQFFRAAGSGSRRRTTASKGGKRGEGRLAAAQEIIHGIDQSSPRVRDSSVRTQCTSFSHGRARAPEEMYRPLSKDKTASTVRTGSFLQSEDDLPPRLPAFKCSGTIELSSDP